ncbi:MAG TPA: DUF2254 family protein, partial [Trueperaceae bacterium]|nr:DUF2254 family protein [Trueperaceae bacterium]
MDGYVEHEGGNSGESELLDTLRRAFREFLALPTLIIVGFLLLAAGTYVLDAGAADWIGPVREFLQARIFASAQGTSGLLGVVAGAIITVRSITTSLLLLALQQSAAAMTTQVFDQFLRRPLNQAYFGFFVGLALLALVTLATVSETFNPVFGASLTLLLTFIGLNLLILLLYTTINQMRPVVIIEAIRDHVMSAREREKQILAKTLRESNFDAADTLPVRLPVRLPVHLSRHGFMNHLDLDGIGNAAEEANDEVEVEMLATIGTFVAFGDVIAEVRAREHGVALKVAEAVAAAVHLEAVRDIDSDPAYGIAQLEMIAWTAVSTAHSNPLPGLLAIYNLRDVMARWSSPDALERESTPLPIIYLDNTFVRLLQALESIAVVSSESLQHQPFTEVIRTFATMFGRLPDDMKERTEDVILRLLSALGDHVLTGELERSLVDLVQALRSAG